MPSIQTKDGTDVQIHAGTDSRLRLRIFSVFIAVYPDYLADKCTGFKHRCCMSLYNYHSIFRNSGNWANGGRTPRGNEAV